MRVSQWNGQRASIAGADIALWVPVDAFETRDDLKLRQHATRCTFRIVIYLDREAQTPRLPGGDSELIGSE